MGGYSDKLSYNERWNVIHYIRSMQAGVKKLEYSEKANSLNATSTPESQMKKVVAEVVLVENTVDTTLVKPVAEEKSHH